LRTGQTAERRQVGEQAVIQLVHIASVLL
jgi:hypothetical protein